MRGPLPFLLKRTRLALIQLGNTSTDKAANLAHARSEVLRAVKEAPGHGVDMAVLPECFNSPYNVDLFGKYAESFGGLYEQVKQLSAVPGDVEHAWRVDNLDNQRSFELSDAMLAASPSLRMLSALAAEAKIVLVGGSVPERDERTGRLYNTSVVLDSQAFGRFGLGICYDMRFPEMAMIAARIGAAAMVYPGAFNTTTGPMAWELLLRARAVDNQMYTIACSPARPAEGYPAWGHSTVVNPWAQVDVTCDEKPAIIYTTLEPEKVAEVRKMVPVSMQRRFDVYPDVAH